MRRPILLLFFLLPRLGSAQVEALRPSPSVLFHAAATDTASDTVKVDTGIPQNEGAFFGTLLGAGAGYFLATRSGGGDPTCSYYLAGTGGCGPTKASAGDRLVAAGLGGLVGFAIGSYLTRPRARPSTGSMRWSGPLGPSPSRLFAASQVADTTPARPHHTMIHSAAVGSGVGALIGAGLGGMMAAGRSGGGDDPGMQPIFFGAVGAVVGFVVGASLADHHGT